MKMVRIKNILSSWFFLFFYFKLFFCFYIILRCLLLPIFGFPKKKRKYKNYIYISKKNIRKKSKKIIGARKGCWNAEKIPKLVEEVQKRLKFDSIFFTSESHVDKKNSIWGRKVQNQMFMDSIKSYLRFNWIYGVFDCKKNWFLSQFRFLLDEIKVPGSNYNFEQLIWSNQGFNCIIIEVGWPIRDLIETIQNQWPNQKKALKARDLITIVLGA